ncbi:MAG: GIN domain-containing protein [Cytophaga sp.]|uniref:GIN domain-containing protein n=1 Tax=Cytophaga sp. TaxID=29535 RepID=UPI003F7F80AE
MKPFSAILIVSLFVFASCKKSNEEPEYDYGPFNYGQISSISANGNIVIDLVQGTSNEVVRITKGGPQVMSSGGALILNGGGTVRLSVKDPLSISMNGFGGVKNTGAVTMKSLGIYNQSGTIYLDSLTTEQFSVTLNNLGDCQVSGRTSYLTVSATNLPTFYGLGLAADSCLIYGSTMGQIQLNVAQKLGGISYGSGTIFYKGNPDVTLQMQGGGRLVHLQ